MEPRLTCVRAMKARGMAIDPAARLIPDLLKANAAVEKVTVVEKNLPMTPWSDGKLHSSIVVPIPVVADLSDPLLHRVGYVCGP